MNPSLIGLIALAVVIPGAFMTWDDFKDGHSRFWLSGGIDMFDFSRATSGWFFWASTIVNGLLIAIILVGGLLLVAKPWIGH